MMDRIGFEDPRLQRMEEATLWLQRMRAAGPDDRIVDEWLDWCQRDPLNLQAFDDISAVWEVSGHLPREPVTTKAASSGARIPRRAMAASLAGLGLAGLAATLWWQTSRDNVLVSEFESRIGENSVRKLGDGSVLELGGGTRVTVSLGKRERHVTLHEGEVFATVRHDASRPFFVTSGVLDVVATGTAFNVLRTAHRTTVTVTEGSVAAFQEGRSAEANVRLQKGQQLTYAHASHSVAVRQADQAHSATWRTGVLYFQGEPLAEVIASINRYTAASITIDDSLVGKLAYTGTVHTNAVESWLAALPYSFAVTVVKQPDGSRVIGPRPVDHRN
jgi:transmembrane sensor